MRESHEVYFGVLVDVAEESLDRATKILAGIEGGAKKAIGNALTRTASAGKTYIKKPVSEEYAISSGQFLRYTHNINHFSKGGGDILSVEFGFRGNVIPLLQYQTHFGKDGRVTTSVKRGSKSTLEHAFYAKLGSHGGIFERLTDARFPIQELYGPATPQMMYSNEDVLDKTEEHMVDTLNKRVDHEITRILNGWGR